MIGVGVVVKLSGPVVVDEIPVLVKIEGEVVTVEVVIRVRHAGSTHEISADFSEGGGVGCFKAGITGSSLSVLHVYIITIDKTGSRTLA